MSNSSERLTLTLEEAGKILGLGRSKLYELARSGQFPSPVIRVGRSWLVLRRPFEKLLQCGGDDGPDVA